MYSSRFSWVWVALALFVGACGDAAEFQFGENVTSLEFEFFHPDEGIHPSNQVLRNPRNPFRELAISPEVKFDILANGGNAGAFYAWATLLVREPTGEHQHFTAIKLRDIYESGEVVGAEREMVREMAIRGFQTVLDDFPDAVTFDPTGTQAFRLATPALMGILDLNGDVLGDWVLLPNEAGELVAVRGSGRDRPETQDEIG